MKPSLAIVLALLTACASTPPPRPAPSPSGPTTTSAEAPTSENVSRCEVVCEGARIVPQAGETPDYHARAVANADRVFAAMHGDLLACYKARVAVDPKAHGFITVDVVIGPDGAVRSVETTGGAPLGEKAMGCIVERIRAATFEPMPGGGTRRIQVPFAFRRTSADESI
jgi:hypothetical protein